MLWNYMLIIKKKKYKKCWNLSASTIAKKNLIKTSQFNVMSWRCCAECSTIRCKTLWIPWCPTNKPFAWHYFCAWKCLECTCSFFAISSLPFRSIAWIYWKIWIVCNIHINWNKWLREVKKKQRCANSLP